MEKRVFLAIFLSFVVLAGYQAMFPPPPPVQPPPTAPAGVPGSSIADPTTVGVGAASASAAPVPAPGVTPIVGDTQARDIVIETSRVRAVFSSRGATLTSWQLKGYLQDGQPLELIPQQAPPTVPLPFTLSTDDPAISQTLATALFQPSVGSLDLGDTAGQLTFEYRDASGLSARKTFYFQPEGRAYLMKLDAAVDLNGSSRPVSVSAGAGVGQGYKPEGWNATPVRAIYHAEGDVERLDADDLATWTTPRPGEFLFVGVNDQYFLNAALPGGVPVSITYRPLTVPVPNGAPDETGTLIAYAVGVPGSLSMSFFLGPKDFDILRSIDPRLELVRAIDFGMLAPLVVQLLLALKWVHGFLGNYGWSIVALTVIINVLIFPLRHRSMVSMRKMQALQPEIKAIQERYAKYKVTDPERQKMNQEMMGLYKQKGVNPVSGCIPMLLTMPILFAFYAMLSAAIELRGAPFFGWIDDLSRHDPLYITPILMGASMFWQQKLMPMNADPIQQKLFLLMPVIFTVSFLWAPSGLVVYWFFSNLLAIGQQYFTNRMIGPPPAPTVRPATVPARAAARRR